MSELPSSWEIVPIADIVIDCEQQVPASDEVFQYIDISSVDREKKVINSPQTLLGREAPSRARKRIRAGDVLVSMTRPNLNAVALVPANLDGQIASTGFDVLRAPSLDPRWLFYVVCSEAFIVRMTELVQGALYPAIRSSDVRGFKIPVAPLNEQKRVADKLDLVVARVHACSDRLHRGHSVVQRFRQSVLSAATSGSLTAEWRRARGVGAESQSFGYADADAFGSYHFPSSWGLGRLGDIATIDGGVTKDIKQQFSEYIEIPYLRVANVQRGYLDLDDVKTIRVPEERMPDLLLKSGDILFTEGGDIDKLGRGWVWNGEIDPCVFQNHIFRARLRDPEFSPRFYSWYANSRGYSYFLSHGKQTTNLASINKSVLSALPVPIPSADEQREIVRRVQSLFDYSDLLSVRLVAAQRRLERIIPALLEKAFQGELVPQDPDDEPASILLDQIRVARAELADMPKVRKPRGAMKVSRRPPKSLIDVLSEAADWVSTEEAFRLCGVADGAETNRVEELYTELRLLDEAGQLQTEPVRDAEGRKLYDRLRVTHQE